MQHEDRVQQPLTKPFCLPSLSPCQGVCVMRLPTLALIAYRLLLHIWPSLSVLEIRQAFHKICQSTNRTKVVSRLQVIDVF